jgi:hypothetical protein
MEANSERESLRHDVFFSFSVAASSSFSCARGRRRTKKEERRAKKNERTKSEFSE